MEDIKVCVIGAGPSGITVIKNLLDKGISVVGIDQNTDVGGNWLYSPMNLTAVFLKQHI